MQITMQRPFERVSFARQFLLASALVLVLGVVAIGAWLGREIEKSAVNRTAQIAALYVESMVAAQLHDWSSPGALSGEAHTMLDRIFVDGPLARNVVRLKLWDGNGRIVYSSDHEQIGQAFPLSTDLEEAFGGRIRAEISELSSADNQAEKRRWSRLLEVYVPVHDRSAGKVIAVMEFYHSMDELEQEIRGTEEKAWLLIMLCAAVIYAGLYGFIRRASDTIDGQQRDLRSQLTRQKATLGENDAMRERLKEASAHMTAMNEQALRRTAADLHDGPAQELAFALLRFDDLKCACNGSCAAGRPIELDQIHGALRDSLDELRAIAGGLGIPGIERLNLADTLHRAVRDVERRSAGGIATEIGGDLGDAPLEKKITAYRLALEALTNARRHAPGSPPRLRAWREEDTVIVEVADSGPGFDPLAADSGRLGLAFMRERVRLVGGLFEVDSAPERGTVIRARIPLTEDEAAHHV